MKKPTFKSLADQLDKCARAYAADGPDYLRERMLSLIKQVRETLDEAEETLNDLGALAEERDETPDTGELEAVR